MKQKKLFWSIIFLLFSSCTPSYTNTQIPESTTSPQAVSPSATIPAATTPPSLTPGLPLTATLAQDIAALNTQEITDPWIVTILGTELPPPWHDQNVLFSPNGKLLVSAYSSTISLWEVGSFRKLNEFTFMNENYRVARFAFSSDSRFLAATTFSYEEKTHLFVWDTSTMTKIFETSLDEAILNQYSEYPDHQYARALAFVPNSARLVVANGNTIQIIDMEDTSKIITIKLGQDMYAEEISFPRDGRFIYVFMEWLKDHGFVSYPRYETKYVLQIWDTNAQFLWRTFEFLEEGWPFSKELHGSYLVTRDSGKGTLEMMNLENEEVNQLPYRQGTYFITPDNKYILFSRYKEEEGIEVWTTDSWRMVFRLRPKHETCFDSDISSDSSLLAMACAGQVIVYDLRIITSP
jgi:uncharacterized protein with WD repeat